MRIHRAGMRRQRIRRLDHLKVDVRHVTETGTGIIRVPSAPGNQCAGRHALAVRDIELAYMAIEEGNGIALVIREDIRYDDDRPSLRPTRDRPIGYPVGGPRRHGVQTCAAVENDVDGVSIKRPVVTS